MTDMDRLIDALTSQTSAINSLIESNARLMMILAEGTIDEEAQPTTYLDGTPVR
jgi:hypothetical protein